MLKVIFLDIDGVLNNIETFIKRHFNGNKGLEIDLERVEYLKEIVNRTGSQIVLSSSWRHYFKREDNSIVPICDKGSRLLRILNHYGLEIYDITPYSSSGLRQDEIMAWINQHKVESFIVIDDDSYDLQMFLNKELIKTSYTNDEEMVKSMQDCRGLCEHDIDRAVKILNKKMK